MNRNSSIRSGTIERSPVRPVMEKTVNSGLLEQDEIIMAIEGVDILDAVYEQNLLANITSRQQLEVLPGHNVWTFPNLGAGLLRRWHCAGGLSNHEVPLDCERISQILGFLRIFACWQVRTYPF